MGSISIGENFTDVFSMEVIRNALKQTSFDIETSSKREEVKKWIERNPHLLDDFIDTLKQSAKRKTLERIANKIEYIEEIENGDFDVALNSLKLLHIYYYESYFNYTDHSEKIFKIPKFGGIFKQIYEQANSGEEANKIFTKFCQESEHIESAFLEATKGPASIIGSLEENVLPRIIKWEDEDHLYAEFWSIGKTIRNFDVKEGDYKTINALARTIVRIHLDYGILEYTSDDRTKGHRESLIEDILQKFNSSSKLNTNYELLRITNTKIREIKNSIATISTLDDFRGNISNLRFSSNKNRNVETDRLHKNAEEGRSYRMSHPVVIIGQKKQDLDLIQSFDSLKNEDFETEDFKGEIRRNIKENRDYEKVIFITIVLNSDKDTLRVWKKCCSPSLRRKVFHVILNEL